MCIEKRAATDVCALKRAATDVCTLNATPQLSVLGRGAYARALRKARRAAESVHGKCIDARMYAGVYGARCAQTIYRGGY